MQSGGPGNENNLRLRLYGERGGLDWSQEHPNQLRLAAVGEAPTVLSRGQPSLSVDAAGATRIPAGHPEGYLEGFAQLYADAADLLEGHSRAELLPGIDDGVARIAFIEAAVASSRAGGVWTALQC